MYVCITIYISYDYLCKLALSSSSSTVSAEPIKLNAHTFM